MGQKKELGGIVDAVKEILGYGVKAKKLKKAKAMKSFIDDMEKRREEIAEKLAKGDVKKEDEKTLQRNLGTLDKQINKAKKFLDNM